MTLYLHCPVCGEIMASEELDSLEDLKHNNITWHCPNGHKCSIEYCGRICPHTHEYCVQENRTFCKRCIIAGIMELKAPPALKKKILQGMKMFFREQKEIK